MSVPPVMLLVLLALAPCTARADGEQDVQFWTPTTVGKVFDDRWSAQVETQVRFVENVAELQNSLIRPAVVYRATPRTSLFFGYAFVPYFYPARRNEQRLWQQLITSATVRRWTLTPRVRLEERFLPSTEGVAIRLRGQMRAMRPLSRNGAWQLSLSDEVFFHLNSVSESVQAGFSANRTQVGLNRRVSRFMTVEPGYLLQLTRRAGGQKDIAHVATLTTNVRF
jgi:hypothetical protein